VVGAAEALEEGRVVGRREGELDAAVVGLADLPERLSGRIQFRRAGRQIGSQHAAERKTERVLFHKSRGPLP